MDISVKRLQNYRALKGLFARVAKRLRLDPSYVSRVANGQRSCKRISAAIDAELNTSRTPARKAARPAGKRAPPIASRHPVVPGIRGRS